MKLCLYFVAFPRYSEFVYKGKCDVTYISLNSVDKESVVFGDWQVFVNVIIRQKVLGVLMQCALLYSTCDLKVAKMNIQHSFIWNLLFTSS